MKLQDPPKIAGASIPELLEILKRPEYRYRYWAKRELRERESDQVKQALDAWVAKLDPKDPRFRHHQVEAIWNYRNVGEVNLDLFREVFHCEERHARAAATRQLRYWSSQLPDANELLRKAANDSSGLVRMEAAIAASYVGTKEALDAMLEVFKHPREKHLAYAITCALGSASLRRHWEGDPNYDVAGLLKQASRDSELKEPTPNASEAQFDSQKNLKLVKISCVPERMRYDVVGDADSKTEQGHSHGVQRFAALTGQPVKLVFVNPDATDHNLVVVKPGALEEVGMAANLMAKDPKHANSDFIPAEKKHLILAASPMIGPTRKSRVTVMRFTAPKAAGIYPFVCTFPGHWVVMKGEIVVAETLQDVRVVLASRKKATFIKNWKTSDFADLKTNHDERTVMRGMDAFMKARCN
ncbi:MAG: HEAT repeat domain-containing protein, partial [Planctomycetales bacterium]